jgi:predicted nuclease of predicted toxin-antitoxin system
LRLLLDEHLSARRIAQPLRRRGHDVLALEEQHAARALPDDEVLVLAADGGRILVTCDAVDFTILARAWQEDGRRHSGLIIAWSRRNHEFRAIVDGVARLLEQRPDQDAWLDIVLTL